MFHTFKASLSRSLHCGGVNVETAKAVMATLFYRVYAVSANPNPENILCKSRKALKIKTFTLMQQGLHIHLKLTLLNYTLLSILTKNKRQIGQAPPCPILS